MAHQRAWVSGNKLVDEGICLEGAGSPRGGKRVQSPLEFACFFMEKIHVLAEAGLHNDNRLHLQIIFTYIVSSGVELLNNAVSFYYTLPPGFSEQLLLLEPYSLEVRFLLI